jgi:hypothetical protein
VRPFQDARAADRVSLVCENVVDTVRLGLKGIEQPFAATADRTRPFMG